MSQTFFGQSREDRYINQFFAPDYIGCCVDVGAYDGMFDNNTYYFERKGWRTLCVEPLPEKYSECCTHRKECVNCCVSDSDTDNVPFHVFKRGIHTGAISSLKPDSRLIDQLRGTIDDYYSIPINTRTLTSILKEHNFPTTIDFISIDTENTELDVLKGLDLVYYNVKYLIVENNFNDPDCEEYLKSFGYVKIDRIGANDMFKK
jgi:FkbM family methyltransferase